MQLTCKNCGALIPARHINVQTMTAVCEACDAIFTFDPKELPTGKKTKRLKIEQPPGYKINETADGVQIDIRWWRPIGSLERLGLALLLTGGLCFGALGLLAAMAMWAPGAIFLLISLFFWYLIAMGPFNHTTIEVDAEQLRVRHKPLWYPGKTLDQHDIQALTLTPLEYFSGYQTLKAVLSDDSETSLDVYPTGHAAYLKHMLEQTLGFGEAQPAPLLPLEGERLRVGADGELVPIEDDMPLGTDTGARKQQSSG